MPASSSPKNSGFLKDRQKETTTTNQEILTETPPFPRNILVELTNACNHRCMFCFNKHANRKRGFIDSDLLASILAQAHELGARETGFYMTGESLLHKDLANQIATAKQLGYEYVYLTTNGVLLTPERTEQLFAAGIDSLKFSINAATRDTYHTVHGRDDFDQVLQNLRFLREYRDAHGPHVKLGASYVVAPANEKEKPLAAQLIGPLVDDILFYDVANQGGYMTAKDFPQVVSSAPCPMLFNRFHVTHEGNFTLCCVDYQNYLAVADLREVSVEEAWRSKRATAMRRRHLTGELSGTICHNCITGDMQTPRPLNPALSTPYDF